MERIFWINKLKASGIHLALSIVIFLVFLYVLIFHWYPLPYFNSDGGWQGMRIMLYVDVVLGPLLTLIVFNYKKSRNKIIFDLSVIVLIQLGALIWGINTVYNGRPVVIVYNEGRFASVEANNFYTLGVDTNTIKGAGNPPIFAVSPIKGKEDLEERLKLYKKGFVEILVVQKYEAVEDSIKRIVSESPKIEKVLLRKKLRKEVLDRFLEKTNRKLEDLNIFNYIGKFSGGMIIFDKQGIYIETLLD